MRLKEIEARLSAIKAELENENADITALTTETDALIEERKGLLAGIEKRKNLLDSIANGTKGTLIKDFKEGGEMEERKTGVDSAEYRSAFMNHLRGIELTDAEKRAFTTGTGSAGAAVPTQTAQDIITKVKQIAPLLNEVTLLSVAGGVTFAVEGAKADAQLHTENATITGDNDTLVNVTLSAYEITKLVQVSESVKTMSITSFETWLVDMIAEKIAEKIDALLISGTGSSQPTGIEKANTWGATNSVTVAASASLTAANVQSLIALLPGSYDKNAKFVMSKKTLFTDFLPLMDASKNKIVTNEGNQYYVYGYPVLLDDFVGADEAYLGDFKKIVANLAENINVKSAFDINTNSYKYLGVALFDSKIAVGEAFVKLIKAAA